MSKHIGRKQRWAQQTARLYSSDLGRVVYEEHAWYGIIDYKTRAETELHAPAVWEAQIRRLGPFKRPRDAMVAAEREVTMLRNRHGERILVGDQLWAES